VILFLEFGPGKGQIHQRLVRSGSFRSDRACFGPQLHVLPIGFKNPCLAPVVQADIKDLPKALLGGGGAHRCDHLDAFGEVAEHPVRRSDEVLAVGWILFSVGKVKDA
jgi:hypothetical protein